jgi:hypothetical protein
MKGSFHIPQSDECLDSIECLHTIQLEEEKEECDREYTPEIY